MAESDELLTSLCSPIVEIGTDEAQLTQMGKPFPLVLSPPEGTFVSFVELQEYFLTHHELIRRAASEYGAVMFKGFDIRSGNEWASVMYKSGLHQMEYIGGAAVRNLIIGNDSRMDNP